MIKDKISNRLKVAMQNKNILPIQLAKLTGIDKSSISNYLSGKYKANQFSLTKLSDVLGVSETWLMGYDVSVTDRTGSDTDKEYIYKYSLLSNEDKKTINDLIDFKLYGGKRGK